MKKKIFILFCLICIIFISRYTLRSMSKSSDISSNAEYYNSNNNGEDNSDLNNTNAPSSTDNSNLHNNVEIDTTPDSYTVLVNKEYGLPSDYVPEDLVVPDITYSFSYYDEKKLLRSVAASALEDLVAGAANDGCTIKGVSGYRSYKRQETIYNNNIKTKGVEHTEKYSAKPGYSEHQTGLSIDVSCDAAANNLTAAFGKTTEGKWLAENCYKYGFIIRYPEGKESITGYSYEPWHIRYVGVELATYLTENGLTLDEYYNYTPSETLAPDDLADDYDLEDVPDPTATPKTYSTYTTAPKATTAPVATAASTETPEPTEEATAAPTEKPTTTPKPEKTETPVKTESPTKKPTATPKPTATTKPASTPKPTKAPATAKPTAAPTEKPVATKAPADTGNDEDSVGTDVEE